MIGIESHLIIRAGSRGGGRAVQYAINDYLLPASPIFMMLSLCISGSKPPLSRLKCFVDFLLKLGVLMIILGVVYDHFSFP